MIPFIVMMVGAIHPAHAVRSIADVEVESIPEIHSTDLLIDRSPALDPETAEALSEIYDINEEDRRLESSYDYDSDSS